MSKSLSQLTRRSSPWSDDCRSESKSTLYRRASPTSPTLGTFCSSTMVLIRPADFFLSLGNVGLRRMPGRPREKRSSEIWKWPSSSSMTVGSMPESSYSSRGVMGGGDGLQSTAGGVSTVVSWGASSSPGRVETASHLSMAESSTGFFFLVTAGCCGRRWLGAGLPAVPRPTSPS